MIKVLDFKKISLKLLNIFLCTVLFWTLSEIPNFLSETRSISQAETTSSSGNTGYEPWYYYIGGEVNAANGNLYLAYKDISIKAKGFNIEIVRTYNSLNNASLGPFGYGWTFNYNVYLAEQADQSVTLYEGDGSVHTFAYLEGNYTSPPGMNCKLKKDVDVFSLYFKNGTIYHFNSSNKLSSIIDKNSNTLTFSYSSGKLTEIADDSGLSLTIYYNAENRISGVVDPLGRAINYGYDIFGNLYSVTDAMGNSSRYLYYGSHFLKASINQVGAMLYFEYYSGKVQEIKASLYNFGTGTYLTPKRLYLIEYNADVTDATDALDYLTSIQFNASGNPTRITDSLSGIWTTAWDSDMNVTSSTDAKNHTYHYTYDSYGNLLSQTDPLEHSTISVWQNIDDGTQYISLLQSITNTRGYTTSFDYDTEGNLTQITDAKLQNFINEYNPSGFVTRQVDFRGYETLYSYDTHGNMLSLTDALEKVVTCTYDLVGRLLSIKDPLNHTTSYQYDANDRVTKITDALNHETVYTYNAVGSLINTQDAESHTTALSHNIIGKHDKTTDALNHETSFTFDRTGNNNKIADANNHNTTPVYDALARMTLVTDALGKTESYTYDAVGNMLSERDKNGNTITYGYDALNRPVSVNYPDATSVSTEYDAEGNIIEVTNTVGIGEITNYSYDELDQLTSVSVDYGAFSKTINYGYDANGNQITMTDPNSGVTTYEYDAINRLTSITDPSSNVTTYVYDDADRRIWVNNPNGTYATYAYDAANRLTSLVNRKSSSDVISSYSYTYDNVGNRLSMNSTNYAYDALYRLTDVGSGSTQYTYDAVGNRLTQNALNYTYDAANRLLSTSDGTSYLYDDNGNLISKSAPSGTTTFQYDYDNRLIMVTPPAPGLITTYQYSAMGDRLSKTAGGVTKYYLYDAEDILLEMDASGAQIARYTHGPSIDEPISMNRGSSDSYYHYDGLGSVTSLTNATEDVVATYQYDAFGKIIGQTGSTENPYRFTAREYDSESGIYYYRARTYMSEIGRFLQPDPIFLTNSYIYVGNNPVNLVDPLGLQDTTTADSKDGSIWNTAKTILGKISDFAQVNNPVKLVRKIFSPRGGLRFRDYARIVKTRIGRIMNGMQSVGRVATEALSYLQVLEIILVGIDEGVHGPRCGYCGRPIWEAGGGYVDYDYSSYGVGIPFNVCFKCRPGNSTLICSIGPVLPEHSAPGQKSVPSGTGNGTTSIITKGVTDFPQPPPPPPPPNDTIGCFLAGTPILMADGTEKLIENIKVGDVVSAFDEQSGKLKPDKVSEVFRHPKEDTYLIINGHLKVTPIHPVLSKGKWVSIGTLKLGDTLTDTKGKDVPIESIKVVKEKVDIYNFEVNPYHTYVAGGYIVHNRKPVPYYIPRPFPCFLAGTKILMADGSQKPIEKIRKGDMVLSFDDAARELKPDKVSKVFRRPKENTYLIVNGHIKVTPNHPVLSKGRWKSIGTLKVGDTLTDTKGKDVPIESTKVVKEKVKVYNFEINLYHTYIAEGIVAHNLCSCN